jgi:hypothetical protein
MIRGLHMQTHKLTQVILVKYAVEMGSGAIIYIPSFIEIGSGIQKLIGWGGFIDRQHKDSISLLLFFREELIACFPLI